MSHLEALIERLCPDGVEFKIVKDVAEVGTGRSDRKDAVQEGAYPFYVRSKEIQRINHFEYDETAIVIPGEGGIGEIFHFVTGKYALHQRAYRIHFLDETINVRFAYYWFTVSFGRFIKARAVNATVSSIRKPMIEGFKIPVPPLEVQEEIVRILDKFTALEAELEAELEARRKQYQHYRDQLLSFPEFERGGVFWKSLGEVACYAKTRILVDVLDSKTYVGVDNLLPSQKGRTDSRYIPNTGTAIRYQSGDVLIGNIRPYLKKIWLADNFGGASGDILTIRIMPEASDVIIPAYLYVVLSTETFFTFATNTSRAGSMPRGDKAKILKYRIPVPPLEEQKRIVAILDKFDALVNDLSTGLPAEIEARRKQYNHYRDRLLTFKPIEPISEPLDG
ncbi:MAG: restriction endonuclease subunit S [Actinomycetaceae bacterium]|nr:restriction endonuclease subunit S [Actinomycetaceae bacterium]